MDGLCLQHMHIQYLQYLRTCAETASIVDDTPLKQDTDDAAYID